MQFERNTINHAILVEEDDEAKWRSTQQAITH